MKIILHNGKIPRIQNRVSLDDLLLELKEGLKEKLNNAEELAEVIEEAYFRRVEVDLQFKVKGMDQLQELTVNHHGEDEVLTIMVDIDEDGNIVEVNDNEEESLFDETMVKIMTGTLQKDFEEIESSIDEGSLELCGEVECKDFMLKVFGDPIYKDVAWVQYYQMGRLIQEVKYSLNEGESPEGVLLKYKEAYE